MGSRINAEKLKGGKLPSSHCFAETSRRGKNLKLKWPQKGAKGAKIFFRFFSP
jgi:hypothetical protein